MKKAQIVGEGMTKRNKIIVAAIAAVIVVIGFLSSVKVVGTGQVGVVTQYGKVTGRELDEGLSFVFPFGVQKVTIYDVKLQKQTVDSKAASSDLQDVSSQIVLNYNLRRENISKLHQSIGDTYEDKVITPAINEVFKAASAKYNASELISKRNELKSTTQNIISERLTKYGITVDELSITNFEFSSNFSKAIEDKQVAQQNAERAKFNLEAAKTDAEAQKAQRETLSQEYLQKQAIEKWDGKMPTYMGGGAVFNIPLSQ